MASAIAPSTPHTNGLCGWRSIHGWKWSEIRANVKPASSARRALRDEVAWAVLLARQGVAEGGHQADRFLALGLAGLAAFLVHGPGGALLGLVLADAAVLVRRP